MGISIFSDWRQRFCIDPLPVLLSSEDVALLCFARRDLLAESIDPVKILWGLAEVHRILRRQREDGSWRSKSKTKYKYPTINSDLTETLKNINLLVNRYSFDKRHAAIMNAVDYIFACQTDEGDIRGILGNQYMPYYNGLILEQLLKAGYAGDERLERAMVWLKVYRQNDGGWMIPIQEIWNKDRSIWGAKPVPFDATKPSSHIATGMVLRAFALHPNYQNSREAVEAAELLRARIFQRDPFYASMGKPEFWTKFKYPTWWPNLLTLLEAMAWMGYSKEDKAVKKGLDWFIENQQNDGLWNTGYSDRGDPERIWNIRMWIGLAVCRVFKMY